MVESFQRKNTSKTDREILGKDLLGTDRNEGQMTEPGEMGRSGECAAPLVAWDLAFGTVLAKSSRAKSMSISMSDGHHRAFHRILDQFRAAPDTEVIHHGVLVIGDRSGRNVENEGRFFHRMTFS